MDSMLSAIKAKRGGGNSMADQNTMMDKSPDGQQGPSEMKGLIESLDDSQKQELMMLLSNEAAQKNNDVEKGAPTSNEKQIIEKQAAEENQEGELPMEQSDDIAMSMIDRDSLRKAESNVKPRGLGDRARMAMAQKLKGKGKLNE